MDEEVAECSHEWLLVGYLLNPTRDYFQSATIRLEVFACARCGRILPSAKDARTMIAATRTSRHH